MKRTVAGFMRLMHQAPWLLLLAAGPFFLFPSPQRVWVLGALPLILLINLLVWRRALAVTPLNGPLLLLALMLLVSLWATTDLLASLPKIAGLLYGLLAFFLMAEYARSRKGWAGGLIVYLITGLGLTLIAIPGTNWLSKFFLIDWLTSRLPRSMLILPGAENGFQPIEVAGALLWVLPVTIAAAWSALCNQPPFNFLRFRGLWLVLFALAALAETGVLVLAQSRGAYLGFILAGFLAVFIAVQSRYGWGGVLKLAAGLLAGGAILVFSYWQKISETLFSTGGLFNPKFMSVTTLDLRVVIWSRAVEGLKDFSWTGMGLNRFREVVYELYPTAGLNYGDLGHAHNELLQAGLDLGLPGLVAFLALNIAALWVLYQLFQRAGRRGSREIVSKWILLGLFGGLVSHFLFGMTDAVALGAKPGLLFWMMLGLVAGLFQQVVGPSREGLP